MLNKFFNYSLLTLLIIICACFNKAVYAADAKALIIMPFDDSFNPPLSLTQINFYLAQLRQDPLFLLAMPTNYINSVLSRLKLIELITLSRVSQRHKEIIKSHARNYIVKDLSREDLSAENIIALAELFSETRIILSPEQIAKVIVFELQKHGAKLPSAKL